MKLYRLGTHRQCSPAATLRHAREYGRSIGITRLADVTGLDVIGIPVFQAIRPMARSLTVAQGKGVTRDSARVSALMESIEFDAAERAAADYRGHGSASDRAFARRCGFDPDDRGWCEGVDMISGEKRRVPLAAVSMDFVVNGPVASSNGLASGNGLVEASVSALAELIERDSRAIWVELTVGRRIRTVIDPESIDDLTGKRLMTLVRRAGLLSVIWDLSDPHGVAVIGCAIYEGGPSAGMILPPAFGAGAHPARSVALVRAITEAAQSRATMIAGARDDLIYEDYADPAGARLTLLVASAANPFRQREWGGVPDYSALSCEADLAWLLSRAVAAPGSGEIVQVDLSPPSSGLAVVRLVAPFLRDTAH